MLKPKNKKISNKNLINIQSNTDLSNTVLKKDISINNPIIENKNSNISNKNSKKYLYVILIMVCILLILVIGFIINDLSKNNSNNFPKELGEGILSKEPYIIEDDGAKVYSASHIVVKDLETAKEIIKELNNGTSFSYLAKKYSTDNATSQFGGDLGVFYEGDMTTEFEEAVDSLEVNQYTNIPVKTDYGYHIIKRTKP